MGMKSLTLKKHEAKTIRIKDENTYSLIRLQIYEKVMASYKQLKPFILKWEGGYVNRKNDKGGPTNKGITLKTYRAFYGQQKTIEDLKRLSDVEWDAIFKYWYWDKCKGDELQDQSVANMLVDWAWHSGVVTAVKALQKEVGVKVDGVMGAQTLGAVNKKSPLPVFGALKQARKKFLEGIVRRDATQKENLKGWMNRVNDIVYGGFL